MAIQWRESLSVGVEEIDEQHKELLRRFDTLLTACKEGKAREDLGGMLEFLGEYVRTHFSAEEGIQRLRTYPEYEQHRREHEGFVARLRELQREVDSEGVSVHHVMETNNMLLKWLTNHISVVDKKLGAFLQAKQ